MEAVPKSASKMMAVFSAAAKASASFFFPGSGLGAVGGASECWRFQAGGGLLASGITAFSTTAVGKAKKARLAMAKYLVTLSTLGSSEVALMNSRL